MVKFQPEGLHTVTPRIVTRNPDKLVRFLKDVFDAKGEWRPGMPAEIRIGDSVVMISGDGRRDSMPAFLYVYVADTDVTYQRAIAADATSLEEPTCRTATDAQWSRTRGAILGRLQLTKKICPLTRSAHAWAGLGNEARQRLARRLCRRRERVAGQQFIRRPPDGVIRRE